MKILFIVNQMDFDGRLFGATPFLWQLMKAVRQLGNEVWCVPIYGRSISSLWWKCLPGDFFFMSAILGNKGLTRKSNKIISHKLMLIWSRRLTRIIKNNHIDALLFVSTPIDLIAGLPTLVRAKLDTPSFYYEIDAPICLPPYDPHSYWANVGASEFECIMTPSKGAEEYFRACGAKRVETVYFGVDPSVYPHINMPPLYDVSFFGFGLGCRESAFSQLIFQPSVELPNLVFAAAVSCLHPESIRGSRVVNVGHVPYLSLPTLCSQSKINVNIAREPFAKVNRSSVLRMFELAAMRCTIVTNHMDGIETWFAPNSELKVVNGKEAAMQTYMSLVANDGERKQLSSNAYARLLRDHHIDLRARQIEGIMFR